MAQAYAQVGFLAMGNRQSAVGMSLTDESGDAVAPPLS